MPFMSSNLHNYNLVQCENFCGMRLKSRTICEKFAGAVINSGFGYMEIVLKSPGYTGIAQHHFMRVPL